MRSINQAGLNLIEQFEGCKLAPYLDVVGIPTIGIGTTHYPDGTPVTMKDPAISKAEAYAFLKSHLQQDCNSVEQKVKVALNDNQFAALVSFVYNLGAGAFGSSTLLKRLNAGEIQKAADEILKWDHAKGVAVAGLTRRRQAERALFLHPV